MQLLVAALALHAFTGLAHAVPIPTDGRPSSPHNLWPPQGMSNPIAAGLGAIAGSLTTGLALGHVHKKQLGRVNRELERTSNHLQQAEETLGHVAYQNWEDGRKAGYEEATSIHERERQNQDAFNEVSHCWIRRLEDVARHDARNAMEWPQQWAEDLADDIWKECLAEVSPFSDVTRRRRPEVNIKQAARQLQLREGVHVGPFEQRSGEEGAPNLFAKLEPALRHGLVQLQRWSGHAMPALIRTASSTAKTAASAESAARDFAY
ncbi:MAG: hypothetical protein M1826_000845 [Phylliscum demangeonii]|nr:MAG: hypothetical protein M1826_000845 [Phylliscum demangeonii]